MSSEPLLMIPGPTNLPEPVREALSQPSIYHRGSQFAQLLVLQHWRNGGRHRQLPLAG